MNINPHQEQGESGDTLFRDVLSLALLGFMAVIVLLLPHISERATKKESEIPSPGNISIEIAWPNNSYADLDLWVEGPGEVPVGYSNQGGTLFNLLRDDLGSKFDLSSVNHENAYSRGLRPGEYVVNVHAFRLDKRTPLPLEVEMAITIVLNTDSGVNIVPVLLKTAQIQHRGQELTFARFSLDEDGNLVEGSINSLFKPLRSGDKNK